MENRISNLENYTVKPKGSSENPVPRCRFYYLAGEELWKEFDVEGHYDLDGAFELAKNIMAADVVQMALKESIRSLDIKSKNFHFIKNGETEDLRDYTFDKDILDKDSDLFKAFKQLLLDNWNEDIVWYYFRADAARNANIHDDGDKKTLYDHYFDELKEFNDRISFLEYYGTINEDWSEYEGNRTISYDLNRYGDYHCVDNTVTRDDLYHFLISNNIRVSRNIFLNNIYTWGAFSYHYGMNNGLSHIESVSFAKEITEIFSLIEREYVTYLPLPDAFTRDIETDKFFKEMEISTLIHRIVSNGIDDAHKHAKEIFFTVFDLYKNHIQNFEYKTKRLEFRVSQRQYDRFMALSGKSKSDKLNALMEYPKDEVPYSALPDISFDEESRKNWLKTHDENYDVGYETAEWIGVMKPSLELKYGEDMEITHVNSAWGCSSPKEKYLIDNEGFDKVLDMETARSEHEMEWLLNCDGPGAPTPKEMEWEWEVMSPESRNEIRKNSIKQYYKSLSPEDLEVYFKKMKEDGMSQDELEEFKRYLTDVVDKEGYDYDEEMKNEIEEIIKKNLNIDSLEDVEWAETVDNPESEDSGDED